MPLKPPPPAHTPTPWSRNIPPASRYPFIFSGRNTHVCRVLTIGLSEPEIEANCAFIVRAVNAHEALVAALSVLVDHASETYPHFEDHRGQVDIAQARSALRLASGEP